MKYRTVSGQTVDEIAWRYYGDISGATEAVLDANCGLAEQGPTLPGGVIIELPEYEPPKPNQGIRLWD